MRYLLPQLLSQAAERTPSHPAICCRAETLSYAELFHRAACLAEVLRQAGVKTGDRVGIYMNKCVDCATAIYGIMAAGAAYVPLDPDAPAARLRYVIDSCGIRCLVSEPRMADVLPVLCEKSDIVAVIGVDGDIEQAEQTISWPEVVTRMVPGFPDLGITENQLAYILFTSGSTGVPKGIMHTHRSAMAWAEVTSSSYRLTARDRISNYAPLHFDLSTLDYFGAAWAGATTVIIPEEYTRFPASLAALIADEALSIFYTVPYALLQLLRAGVLDKHEYPALRAVLFGGEPMPPKYLREMLACWPAADFYNVYGPTETNGVTHQLIRPAELDSGRAIPIGVVYPNVDALVMDEQQQAVADGTVGELYISAATCMRGYWQRPDLNQRVFWYRQQDCQQAEVFVRTGDLVSRRADGLFEFSGRKDRLIKTRGYRVELDDVEASLVAHQSVAEGAVYAVPDPTGSVNIVASVIPAEPALFRLPDLQNYLRRHLPSYALPRSIHVMTDFPRTSTGKIDRVTMAAQAVNE
jgi:amino acid adenylation domain-containing protein